MESLGKLQLHHKPFHLSLAHTSSSFPRTPKCLPMIRPVSASISPLKSTCITLTTAAALLLVNLQLKSPALASPVAPPPQSQSSVESQEELSLEDEERALDEHLATHPCDVDALRSLMEVKIKSRKLTEAVQVVDRLIEIEPEESEWPFLKANIFTYSGDLDSAKSGFEEILAKDPLSVQAYHGLLLAYSDSGLDLRDVERRIGEAMVRCKEEKNENDLRDFKLLVAQIRVVEGKHSEALKLYQELAKEEPGDFRPYLCQGIIYTLLKKKDKAEEHFDMFRKLVPQNHPYREYFMDNMIATKLFSEKTQREMAQSQA